VSAKNQQVQGSASEALLLFILFLGANQENDGVMFWLGWVLTVYWLFVSISRTEIARAYWKGLAGK
jgi:hypothetical protein